MSINLGGAYRSQFAVLIISLAFLLVYEVLPKRTRSLVPAPIESLALYSDASRGGESQIRWVGTGQKWSCDFRKTGDIAYCGMTVSFDWSNQKGVDLSRYDEVHLEIDASPNLKQLTMSMRNYHPDYATVGDVETYMYVSAAIPQREFNMPLVIDLREFRVAEWWIQQFDIPRRHHIPRFNHVSSIGFDVDWVSQEGTYEVQVKSCVFVGEMVSRATWYLCAVVFWILLSIFQLTSAAVKAHKKSVRDRAVIEKMAVIQQNLLVQNAEFEKRSTIDPLTQVLNRLGFDNVLDGLKESEFAELSGVFIVLDIDHFKSINDRFGHPVGDKVIVQIAAVLRKNVRELDSVVRWGGEEFLLCLPNCSLANGEVIAEKIRIAIENTDIIDEPEIKLSASFGVAAFRVNGDVAHAFEQADKALYRAKRNGRNRVVVVDSAPK